jgi:putative ATP-dependent endonuclease of the OLD family
MIPTSTKFRGHRCFKSEWVGFDNVKPVNVIIGRNNSGKSQLLDLVQSMCRGKLHGSPWTLLCTGVLDEGILKPQFPPGTTGGTLKGSFWNDHGMLLVGKTVRWQVPENGGVTDLEFLDFDASSRWGDESTQERFTLVSNALSQVKPTLTGRKFKRLAAERDIQAEPADSGLSLDLNGRGATNIIRKYLLTSNPTYPREIIQTELRTALNEIFGDDGTFSEILVRQHDESSTEKGPWEVYLVEDRKGAIPLSASGSGLKTVLLVLLNLIVVPHFENQPRRDFVFAFEELENNLHPALLRRLLKYVERWAVSSDAPMFLTTHASAALDLFGVSSDAQVLHVVHDGDSARCIDIKAHFDRVNVVSRLGAKPSDLLHLFPSSSPRTRLFPPTGP